MIEKILSHEKEAIARLIEQYKNKPNFLSLIKIYAKQVQELESVFFQVKNSTALNEQVGLITEGGDLLITEDEFEIIFDSGPAIEGDNLDRMGALIDCSRNNLSDEDYYIKIFNKVEVIIANGIVNNIIRVVKVASDCTSVQYLPHYPASYDIAVFNPQYLLSIEEINAILNLITAAGVGYNFIDSPATPFVFFGDDDGEGFSSTGAPTTGGTFSTIVGSG